MNASSTSSRFSLADLLRVRRKLAPREVVYLLDQFVRSASGFSTGISLRTLYVTIDAPVDQQHLLSTEVTEWPASRVELVREEALETDLDRTRIPQGSDRNRSTVVAQFAAVIYELLGGRNVAFEALRSPLPSLPEDANRILLSALQLKSGDLSVFWDEWTRACGCSSPQEPWRIPRWAPRECGDHEVLELIPVHQGVAPIRLTARRQFRVGRSRNMSDFTPLFQDDDHEGVGVLGKISRIHVLAELAERGIALRDGDGTKSTLNGSLFDDTPLSPYETKLVTGGGVLRIAGDYELELLLAHDSAMMRDWQIENVGRLWSDNRGADFSSARFRPVRGGFVHDAIWLFKAIGFLLGPSRKIQWNNRESDGYFIRSMGGFWLANARTEASRIRVDDAGVGVRQIIPLIPGQTVELGDCRFTVAVESADEVA